MIWGSKDSASGVRGIGQRTPQVLDLTVGERSLEQELKDISGRFTDTSSERYNRIKLSALKASILNALDYLVDN